jgi:oligopeptide/dipeptide ABC transporter ATP-binding protein
MNFTKEPILIVEDLHAMVRQGKHKASIVSNVSFQLHSRKTLAVIGESGSGKTTLALALMRLLPEQFVVTGKVFLDGVDLCRESESKMQTLRGGQIALVFQDPESALNPVFTIGDQVAEAFLLHQRVTREEAEVKTIALLNTVGIARADTAFETYPHQISGGMKQRVMIAMGISAHPKVIILDEPTTALDLTVQKEILLLIKQVQASLGMAEIIISHDMGVVAEMADYVAVMYASEIVEYGPVDDVYASPLHPYTKALFAARPTRQERKKRLPVVDGVPPHNGHLGDHHGCPYHTRCPFAMQKCKSGRVETFRRGDHWAKCWLLEE